MEKARLKLQNEQQKLNALVDEALKNGTPLCETHDIMKQCRIVHDLMFEMEAADNQFMSGKRSMQSS